MGSLKTIPARETYGRGRKMAKEKLEVDFHSILV